MCGIAGIVHFGRPINWPELERFTCALNHRGPDGFGTHVSGNCGLGHTRLAILDLSDAAKCPMPYGGATGQRYWITFNGEIYNFLELKEELSKKGFFFKTQSDTEVILAAYEAWGEDCLLRFNGMFALAIWDSETRSLFIARDRFGVKPLYFLVSNRFAFASELKAFLQLEDFRPAVNSAVAPIVLTHAQAYEGMLDETTMQGVRRLLPGHSLRLKEDGSVSVKRWWETAEHLPSVPETFAQQVEQFRELFYDAVRLRMRSDVPVATCLSGGVDSSAIACMMSQVQKSGNRLERVAANWQNAFVASFPGTMVDERAYAEQVTDYLGITPTVWEFDGSSAIKHIVDSVWSLDDICPGIVVPVWCLYRCLRQAGVVVSLDGHGADELLCGYAWTLDWPLGQVNANLYENMHVSILPSILRNFDRCSTAHGIEIRAPFLDWRIVTYCFALDPLSKAGDGYTKRILREAMKGLMPDSIRLRRQKLGFNSPMIEWFNGGLAPLIEQVMNHPLWLQSPYFDGPQLRAFALEKTRARAWKTEDWDNTMKVWTRINLVLWQMLFVENCIGDLSSLGTESPRAGFV